MKHNAKPGQFFLKVRFAAALIFAFTLCPAAGYAQPSGGCSGVSNITIGSTTYVPTWCQEFNGAVGSAIDTTQWNFDLGNNGGWGNGEVEVYCGPPGYAGNPSQCPTTFSTATAPVYIDGNGHLVIQPINENGSWLSGRLNTEGKENFTYGILVASIEGPNTNAQGLWPAWWALGSNITTVTWPTCGESDMFEDWSPQVLNGAGTAGINSTVHTQDTGGTGVGSRYTFPSGQATNTGFHTYGIVWVNNNMQFFVDNPASPFFTVTPSSLPSGDTWPFNQSMFALLNVAVGGTLGGSTSGLTSPASPMTVDYVRWYTPSTGGGGVTDAPFGGTPATIAGTVMAENYDTGGQGVGYNVTSVNGSDNGYRSDGVDLELSSAPATGNDIGWTAARQWFNYTVNVSTAGTYTVNFLVSAGGGSAVTDAFHLSNAAGTNLSGAVAVPNTGGWQTWTTVTATVTLPAGVQTLTLNQDAGGWNINSMVFAAPSCSSAPAAPGGLTDSGTSSSSTTLNWSAEAAPANCSISNYTILENGASIGTTTGASFTVTGLSASTTYSFTVEATDTAGTSPASSVQTVTTSSSGSGEGPYGGTPASIAGTVMAENYDTGGQGVAYNVTSVNGSDNGYRSDGVDLELASSPATGNDVGWSAAGQWFKYTVNAATAGTYTVTFLVSDGSGAAVTDAFHLSNAAGTNLTGSVAVPNTGGWQTWTTVTATVTLPAGVQTLTLNQDAGGWNIDSMAFALNSSSGGTTSGSTSISAGGPASGTFVADADFSGGTTASTTATIDTSLVSTPAPPQSVFQHERQGAVTYTLPGFTAGASVALNLYFAEINYTASGERRFNIIINGNQVLTNFDIFATAGAGNKGLQENFMTTANSSGQVVIQLTAGTAGQPQISGITASGS